MNRSGISNLARLPWIIVGLGATTLGLVGIVLPVLPTIPFLLVAAFCFAKSSERLRGWLLDNRLFGPYLKNYQEGRRMSRRSKVFTLTKLWVAIGFTALLYVTVSWGRLSLLMVASAVTLHLIRLRPLKPDGADGQ